MNRLEARLANLERKNRALTIALIALAATFLFGFVHQSDSLQAKKIEVIDERGVPLLTFASSRSGGGEITVRDEAGDRRAWLSAEKAGAHLGMSGGENEASAGLGVDPTHARLALTGGRASLSEKVENEIPAIEADSRDGRILFAAPYRKGM